MCSLHFLLKYISCTPRLRSQRTPYTLLVFSHSDFSYHLPVLSSLPYSTSTCIFSSLSLLVCLCNCVAFCAVFCACHPRTQAGRSPPSPQRQRAAQPYKYKYQICIKQSDGIQQRCVSSKSAGNHNPILVAVSAHKYHQIPGV